MIQGLPNENRKGGQALWDSKASQTKYGAPGEIRTPDLMVRSHALYPTELRARAGKAADSIMWKASLWPL